MLAGALNANCGGRDHAPIECERQVIRWAADMLGLPPTSSGLVLSGTSVANLVAVLVARTAALGAASRGGGGGAARLTAYACESAHLCVARALDMAGLGASALRIVPATASGAISIPHLCRSIAADRANGAQPFLVVGTAGSVDIDAIDDLAAQAAIAADLQEGGNAVLPVTTWNNRRVLRAAFVNHRTTSKQWRPSWPRFKRRRSDTPAWVPKPPL